MQLQQYVEQARVPIGIEFQDVMLEEAMKRQQIKRSTSSLLSGLRLRRENQADAVGMPSSSSAIPTTTNDEKTEEDEQEVEETDPEPTIGQNRKDRRSHRAIEGT